MYFSNNLIVASLFVIASSFVNAAPSTSSAYTTTVNSQNDFCLFLPPQPGLVVAVNEDNGIPFCVKKNAVPRAKTFPSGFITTAHYLKSSSYVQVTGFFDRSKYNLGANDGGGQYDNHAKGKPVGAQCKGYKYFVSLIEPDIERFCIRCCQDKADCNTGRSGYGCLRVVSGDYTRDNNFGSSSKNVSTHANNHFDSVLTDLNALTPEGDATSTDDTTSDDATSDDATSDDTTSDDTTSDDTTSDDTTSDDTTSDDAASGADATSTDDATPADDNTSTATTSTTANANQEIAAEIELLKTDLATNDISVDEVQTKWNAFTSKLSTEYPQIAQQISELNTISNSLNNVRQWTAFVNLVSDKIIQLQGTDATPTASSDEASSTTHTDSKEDLKWLFDHRNSHDNQATW